jgi:hypothetical protein
VKNYAEQTAKLSHGGYTMVHIKLRTSKSNFDVCNVDLVQFIIQTNTCTIYIYIQGVPGGMCETLGECSLGQTIPI